MAQASISIANGSGASVRSAINSALEAITTKQSGGTAPSATYPFMEWADTANDLLKQRNAANSAWIIKGTLSEPYNGPVGKGVVGQCQLRYTNATTITLSRYNGRYLLINGAFEEVPAAGVTLGTSGLSSATVYYVYAYMNSGTMTLEASATAYDEDSTYGNKIKTGDATRSLVGLIRTDGSTQFSAALTRSWFNRAYAVQSAWFTAARTTTSTSYVEINSEIRVPFLVWDGEIVGASLVGAALNNNGRLTYTGIAFDGTTPESGISIVTFQYNVNCSLSVEKAGLSEGYHYATVVARVFSDTGTWIGAGSAPERCTLYVAVR